MRHSKFKNTGILFELLTKQITADILSGKEISNAKNILFKYFKENTELGKEWQLYNLLLTEKLKDVNGADRFITIILDQRKKLNNKRLSEEKYNLIKEIKELYPIEDFLKSGVNNYRAIASIYKLFEDHTSRDFKFDIKETFQAKDCIVEHILDKKKKPNNDTDLIKLYEQQSKEMKLLAYKLLIDGLNKKYSVLDDSQKDVLREYINSVANTNSLSLFIKERVDKVITELKTYHNKINDSEIIKIKINEVVNQLEKIKPVKIVKDNQVMALLLSYELIKELNNQFKQ